jgi:hypothetical protein
MVRSLGLALAITVTVGAAAQAQGAGGPAAAAADMQKLQTAMMAAQAAAMRPGDEALGCAALQKELVSTMNDPAIQGYAAKTNAAYARELAARDKKAPMTADMAAALAATLAPGAAMTGLSPMPVPGQQMTPQQMQRAVEAQQLTIAYMNQLAPIMPALMRSQRVGMLATVKSCAWATGGAPFGVPPPVRPPGR